ncbi:hypothetical protein [Nocardioides massiliensis]|uniref:KTSC domain-containing protein n=1 Tax=Nocardioides massiliensis TaxID=1325935 RepID=A0ABT9NJM8_9ACTN|nr:hypothetical protein [Nocardioides massiliensis]MDP9820427.1 hypothetical protein [Nocardioides massiliensis]
MRKSITTTADHVEQLAFNHNGRVEYDTARNELVTVVHGVEYRGPAEELVSDVTETATPGEQPAVEFTDGPSTYGPLFSDAHLAAQLDAWTAGGAA